jgi:hypothetical protein
MGRLWKTARLEAKSLAYTPFLGQKMHSLTNDAVSHRLYRAVENSRLDTMAPPVTSCKSQTDSLGYRRRVSHSPCVETKAPDDCY